MKLEKNWFYYLCISLSIVGFAYILICGVSEIGNSQEYPYARKGMLILIFFLTWVGVHFIALLLARLDIGTKLEKKKTFMPVMEGAYVVLILWAAFFLRYAVIAHLPMEPASDYKTYYEVAEMMKRGTLQEKGEGYCNYIAMFPHIIGYCYILKQVFVLFGTSVWNGQLANVLFSVGTVLVIYRIARKIGGRLPGVIALTAAAFWPSQILYINMLASEYSFSFFLYLSLLLFLHLVMDYHGDTKHGVRGLLLHILLGCLIAVTSAIRPMALILLVAILICILPLKMRLPNMPQNSIPVLVQLLGKGWVRGILILASYLILSNVLTTNTELTINRSVPSFSESFGYNLLVGLNEKSRGGWNEEDSKFLYENLERTASPIEAQIACRNEAMKRIKKDPKALFDLFINKYELLWGNDDYGVTWNQAFLKEQNHLTPERAGFLIESRETNHMVYMVFALFSFMTFIYLLKRRASYLYVPILIYLGTVGMHLLVESQNRYHFHVLPVFMIVASVGIGYIFENAVGFVTSQDLIKQDRDKVKLKEELVLKHFEEEEHEAIKTRYHKMTNAFDMKSAIDKGNVIVTVSKKYMEDAPVKENDVSGETEAIPPKFHEKEREELINKIQTLERSNQELLKKVNALKKKTAGNLKHTRKPPKLNLWRKPK